VSSPLFSCKPGASVLSPVRVEVNSPLGLGLSPASMARSEPSPFKNDGGQFKMRPKVFCFLQDSGFAPKPTCFFLLASCSLFPASSSALRNLSPVVRFSKSLMGRSHSEISFVFLNIPAFVPALCLSFSRSHLLASACPSLIAVRSSSATPSRRILASRCSLSQLFPICKQKVVGMVGRASQVGASARSPDLLGSAAQLKQARNSSPLTSPFAGPLPCSAADGQAPDINLSC